ncbi:MAG: tRNA 4-thiouridine(8) synthase ThiI [Spirochaetes bacterium]|nr:tRNA 4-thiouridine(8) synthase ThiI [Spirochaetota bacterium]
MSDRLFLVKYGEVSLKKGNRPTFMRALRLAIRRRLPGSSVYESWHRIYVECRDRDAPAAAEVLRQTFGLVSYGEAVRAPKEMPAISDAAAGLAASFVAAGLGTRFKVEVRRADKRFPLTSYQIACELGDRILRDVPGLKVDVHQPEWVLAVEIREEAYLYGPESPGPGGLPVGCSGRGVLLLSGGIDSPVAGWMMAKRGLGLEAAYFHTPPFTSGEAREKVIALTRILAGWDPRILLHVVPLTAFVARIRERAPEEETTLLMRAGMMRAAGILAHRRDAGCLVTGESLGQVASQTVESIGFTGSRIDLPVFRPLCGMDKEEIIGLARRIGTFETSTLPYDDCCVLFSPVHPLIRPDRAHMEASWNGLDADTLLAEALERVETIRL